MIFAQNFLLQEPLNIFPNKKQTSQVVNITTTVLLLTDDEASNVNRFPRAWFTRGKRNIRLRHGRCVH
jgi:hypothetical protein